MSSGEELFCFQQLINAVEGAFREKHPAISTPIREWKGQEIVTFQEELLTEVQGRISEKWFYTHIRQVREKLPRIDILNLLSKYAGFDDWQTFCYEINLNPQEQAIQNETVIPAVTQLGLANPKKGRISAVVWMGVAVIILLTTIGAIFLPDSSTTYTFCFVDADSGERLDDPEAIITLTRPEESPLKVPLDEKGCFEVSSDRDWVEFTVEVPYYRPQVIKRKLNKDKRREVVEVKADDYALMLHYFSTSKLEDWKRRRDQLDEMFSSEARIIQVSGRNGIGMEMYNKEEFINKMTIPVKSLKNIKVLNTVYEGDKISRLRFMQEDE